MIYPKNETVWVRHCTPDGDIKFIITSKEIRDYYYIYELQGEKFVKLGRDKDPKALEEKYVIY